MRGTKKGSLVLLVRLERVLLRSVRVRVSSRLTPHPLGTRMHELYTSLGFIHRENFWRIFRKSLQANKENVSPRLPVPY